MRIRLGSITTQIFLGMVLGIVVGSVHSLHPIALKSQILSDIFLRLIKMVVAPLVFSTLVVGIAKLGDIKSLGRIGIKTFLYFQVATVIALLSGMTLVNLMEPGHRMHVTLPQDGVVSGITGKEHRSAKDFITHIVPTSLIQAMAENEILQIVVFSLFFGAAIPSLGKTGEPIVKGLDAVAHIMFKVTGAVMYAAPFGVFGALAAVVAKQGPDILVGYLYLIGCFLGGLLFFVFVILGSVCWVFKISLLKLLVHLKDPLLLAFSTASSEVALPKVIEKMEAFGCSNRITSFVLPLGYSFNLDGSIMYMTFATMFIAQAYGIDFTITQEISMLLMMMVTSKGMAGVPRASLIVIAGALHTFGIPVEGLLLVLGVDQILDMGRSATNVVGNAVATALVSRWEGELDDAKMATI